MCLVIKSFKYNKDKISNNLPSVIKGVTGTDTNKITEAVYEILNSPEYKDEFYKQIPDKIIVKDKDNIEVYLDMFPMKRTFKDCDGLENNFKGTF